MTDLRQRLLWIDSIGGLIAGVIVMAISGWLSKLYGLDQEILLATGVANLAYGSFSLSLARRAVRPIALIRLLAAANLTWLIVCTVLIVAHYDSATFLGIGHLLLEGLYVGGLGCLEWRGREDLRTA